MREIISVNLVCICVLAAAGDTVIIENPNGAHQPQVAIDARGNVHLTFGADGKVFYTFSTDAGTTYARPTVVAEIRSLALGMRRGPRIAVARDTVVISAIGGSESESSSGNLYSWRSRDRGKSWQGPFRVNDVDAAAREGLHGMTAGPNGELYCTWLDLRHKGTQIFGSRANGGGKQWSKNVLIYQSPDGTVCECCHPSVSIDSTGKVYVMWRNSLGGNRDMYLAASHDKGETFAPAFKLGEGSWLLNACPMDGGALAAMATGKIFTVWRRDQEILLTDGGLHKERSIGMGMQPWVAANWQRVYAVWLTRRGSGLNFAKSPEYKPTVLAEQAQFPVVAANPMGKGPVVAAWETGGGRPQIKIARIDSE